MTPLDRKWTLLRELVEARDPLGEALWALRPATKRLYELSCRDLKVHCRTDGGKILALELELRGTQRTFHGDSVEPQPVHNVGVLHTVTLNERPGTPWVGFSLLLPCGGASGHQR